MTFESVESPKPMTRKPKCGWIAAAILTLLAGAAQDGAQAAVLSGMEPLAPRSATARVMFRLPGHTIGGRLPGVGKRPGPISKGPLNRAPKGVAGANATGRTTGGRPPKPSTDLAPPRPTNLDGGSKGRTSNLVVVPGAAAAVTAFAILGAGGAPRQPIAPRYTGEPGQQPAQAAAMLLDSKRHRPRELLVEVSGSTSGEIKEALARDYRAEIAELGAVELAGVRIWHLTLGPAGNLHETLTALLQDRRVLTAQPNYIYTPVQGPPEKKGVLPGNGAALAPPPGKQQPTGAGVKLAIIDTCVEGNHDELQGSIASSFNAAGPASGNCKPENHGTAVASLIAGHGKLHGTAGRAAILSAQAFSFTSEENEVVATSREIALSMDWAAQTGAQVMNLSFAGPADPLIERVVAAAYRKNIGLIAAAGNAGPSSPPLYPAAYPEVIAVTATNGKLEIYGAANRGKYISVSARGVDVLAAHVGNTYGIESGTSFAAAEVSGVVAALLEMRPNAGPEEIRAALQNTAAAVPGAGKDEAGAGVVNPAAALAFVETSLPQ
jgi:subtilisin family serine protease